MSLGVKKEWSEEGEEWRSGDNTYFLTLSSYHFLLTTTFYVLLLQKYNKIHEGGE